jgi:hypothetical protein
MSNSHILDSVKAFVLATYNKPGAASLLYHNYRHAQEMAQLVADIAPVAGLPVTEDEREVAELAAWLYNVGYVLDGTRPAEGSRAAALDVLGAYPHKEAVISCLSVLFGQEPPISTSHFLVMDAKNAYEATTEFAFLNPLEKLETEIFQKGQLPPLVWEQHQLKHLLARKFYTPYAKLQFEGLLARNITQQSQHLADLLARERKGKKMPGTPPARFAGIERGKMPSRGVQTFFRTTFRTHISLSAIADNKANMMIGINAILLSVVISILSYGNILNDKPMVLLPTLIFLVTGLTSMTYSILAARPNVTAINHGQTPSESLSRNVAFFGNFAHLDLEAYERALDEALRNGDLLYGNLARDLYHLGRVLDRKYRLLSLSYSIFLWGFMATVLTFAFALLF